MGDIKWFRVRREPCAPRLPWGTTHVGSSQGSSQLEIRDERSLRHSVEAACTERYMPRFGRRRRYVAGTAHREIQVT